MELTSRFIEALTYAATLHQHQKRKVSDSPYVAHLLRVAGIVLEHGASENEAIAALLHDAVEDQGGAAAREEIRRRFGDEVTAIVDGCSDAETIPKPPWRERKEAHLAELRRASASVRLVIAADKLDNARSLLHEYRHHGPAIWSHFHGRRDGTIWYFRAMVDALKASGVTPLIEELERTMEEVEKME